MHSTPVVRRVLGLSPLLLALAVAGAAQASTVDTPTAAEVAPITIDVTDRPLDQVLQWLSRRSGVNLVCNDKEAEALRVSVRLTNVAWQEAIEQIARKYDFVVERRNDRIWELTRPPRVRMEFQDARLVVVLEALARQAGVNIIISDDIDSRKRITMTLNSVPWRQALDEIVKATGYAWLEKDYKIIRVVKVDQLQRDVETRVYPINYSSVASVAGGTPGTGAKQISLVELVKEFLSTGDKVIGDERTNQLIVTAPRPTHDRIKILLGQVDKRTKQVQIEMRFVDFSTGDARKAGFDPVTMSFDAGQLGRIAGNFRPFAATPTATMDLTRVNGQTQSGFSTPSYGATFEFIATLTSTRILQAPIIRTLDNTPATIEIGRKLRFAEETVTTTDGGAQTRTLQEAKTSPVSDGIKITVLPTITNDGQVRLQLKASNDTATLKTISNKADTTSTDASVITLPDTDTRLVETVIMVGDGRTAVIGGLLHNKATETESKIPGLGNLPILGWLFKKKSESIDQRNLTIFIIPRIVPDEGKSEYDALREGLRSQLSGIAAPPSEPAKASTLQE